MKTFALLLLGVVAPVLSVSLAATNYAVAAKTTGKIASATLKLTPDKTDPVMTLAYHYDITATQPKIKSPVIAFHFVAARPDDTMESMSGWLRRRAKQTEDMVEYDLPREKSRIEPLVPVKTLHTVKGWIKHHPTVQFGVYGKIILYRVELWLDGELLDAFESKSPAEAKAAGVPDDWFKKVGIIEVVPADGKTAEKPTVP